MRARSCWAPSSQGPGGNWPLPGNFQCFSLKTLGPAQHSRAYLTPSPRVAGASPAPAPSSPSGAVQQGPTETLATVCACACTLMPQPLLQCLSLLNIRALPYFSGQRCQPVGPSEARRVLMGDPWLKPFTYSLPLRFCFLLSSLGEWVDKSWCVHRAVHTVGA